MPTLPQVPSATLLSYQGRADIALLADDDPVSTWADQSGNGHNFTQSGDARPLKQTDGNGRPYLAFDGIDDWMLGDDYADNLPAFAVFVIGDKFGLHLTKIANDDCSDPGSKGWVISNGITLYSTVNDYIAQSFIGDIPDSPYVFLCEVLSHSELHCYINGVLMDSSADGGQVIGDGASDISNSEPVRMAIDGAMGNCDGFSAIAPYGDLIYQITDLDNWPVDRAAITAWLMDGAPDIEPETTTKPTIGGARHINFTVNEQPPKKKYDGLY